MNFEEINKNINFLYAYACYFTTTPSVHNIIFAVPGLRSFVAARALNAINPPFRPWAMVPLVPAGGYYYNIITANPVEHEVIIIL